MRTQCVLMLNMIPFTIEDMPFTVYPLIALLMVNANALNRTIGFENLVRGMNLKAGNLNSKNGWIESDVPLLGELGAVADELMVGPIVDEIAEPVDKAEERVIASVVGMDKDIAMLFGDDDFEDDDFTDDDSEGVEEEKVWEVSDVEVATGVSIGEIGPRVFAMKGQMQVLASEMVHAADRREQAAMQHKDTQIQQLQAIVS
nr:hypothetical protein [Tanacetum cinerariifolium]